jgi:hypothetical protein
MRQLRLVGPGEDGTSVIVEAVEPDGSDGSDTSDGERFELSLDDRLRALATEPAASDMQAAPRPESSGPVPTPREIQVRVRAGETAQAVADEAGIPLERVMRFAYPVLQERVRVTDEARRARARRGGDGLLVPFGELLDSRLARHGVDPATVRWDAYRREDGGWTVTAEVSAHERAVLAKFSFTLINRTVSALDDVAADLLSDRPVQALLAPPPAPEPVVEEPSAEWAPDWDAATPPPRLTAVPNPSRAEASRPQEASPAVRPPSRRQKAHTRPVAVEADDELFDQDAFDQQPWHEPPLPFEVGAGRSQPAAPRHRAQRSAGERSDAMARADRAEAGVAEADAGAERGGADSLELPSEPADFSVADFAPSDLPPADLRPDNGSTADAEVAAKAKPAASQTPDAAPPGDLQSKRGRRSGEKPRMPSWDDILLGVRHKSD